MPLFSQINPFKPFTENPAIRAIGLIFLIHGLPLSTWFVYIPLVKDKLHLSEGQIGLALFCFAFGALISMLFSGQIFRKWGDGRVTFYTTWGFCLLIVSPLLAPSYTLLCVSLFFVGAIGGLMDISMNAVASLLEQDSDRYIMSGCHGFFSLGAMLGAALGGLIIPTGISPALHMALLNTPLLLISLILRKEIFDICETKSQEEPIQWALIPLAGIGIMCFGFMMGEGSIHDWSTIFMRDAKSAPVVYMGLGFAAFNAAMALGRFYGDPIQKRLAPLPFILLGGTLALLGLGIILLYDWEIAILGFALIGFGFSGMVPTLFRAAANQPGVSSAQGIATLAGVGYVGFLIGPVILGYIAEYYSLNSTFLFVIFLVCLSLILAPFNLGSSKA